MPTHATLVNGKIPPSLLGDGTPNGAQFLRDDGTWAPAAGGATWGAVTGTLSSQADLQSALDAKADSGHTHAQLHDAVTVADSSSINLTLTGQQVSAEAIFGTTAGTVTQGNDSRLSTFGAASSGIVPASGGGTTNFLRADGTWTTPSAGSDPWTYIKLASDFSTTSASAVDVTGLAFTPGANKTYRFEGLFLLRTATATVGPRPGLAWATGLSDGSVRFLTPSSATANLTTIGNISGAVLVAVGGLPTTTGSWLGDMVGVAVAGATPSGTIKVQLASETAGTSVTIKAGSHLRYREV